MADSGDERAALWAHPASGGQHAGRQHAAAQHHHWKKGPVRRALSVLGLLTLTLAVLLVCGGLVTGWQARHEPPSNSATPPGSAGNSATAFKLVTVVLYSSHEGVYIDALLTNAHTFSDVLVLSVGARQFDSSPEDVVHLAELHRKHPDVALALYPVGPNETDAIALHNRGREHGVMRGRRELAKHGVVAGQGSSVWFLMLDGDEVPDGPRFTAWWQAPATRHKLLNTSEAYKLQNYWLFMLPRLVAEQVEDSVLLVHGSHLTTAALNHPRDRDGIWMANNQTLHVHRSVPGLDGTPMFWHYSWVRRTRAALMHKVMTWGHSTDRNDWQRLVDDAYALTDQGKVPQDFVHGYKLRWVAANDTSHPQPPVVW